MVCLPLLNLPCSTRVYGPDCSQLGDAVGRHRWHQKVHVVPVGANLQELELIASLNPQTDVSQPPKSLPISGPAGLPPIRSPIIDRAVVGTLVVDAPVRGVPVGGWCIVGGRVVAVPGAIVGRIAVAIVGSGAGCQ